MAPHALTDPHDSSDYYPSVQFGACFQSSDAQKCLTSSITDQANLEKDVSSKKLRRLYRLDPHVWHLSPEEVEDVEEGMRYFSGVHYPLLARQVILTSCRFGFSAQRNQPENISFERGPEVQTERRSQEYLWRTAIPRHFRTEFFSAQRLRERYHTRRYFKPYW